MQLDVEVEHSLEHLVLGDEGVACDVAGHDTDWEAHGGGTNWYMQIVCTGCKAKTPVMATCDRFRDWVHTKGHYIECSCMHLTPGWDSVIICKRIDGNW